MEATNTSLLRLGTLFRLATGRLKGKPPLSRPELAFSHLTPIGQLAEEVLTLEISMFTWIRLSPPQKRKFRGLFGARLMSDVFTWEARFALPCLVAIGVRLLSPELVVDCDCCFGLCVAKPICFEQGTRVQIQIQTKKKELAAFCAVARSDPRNLVAQWEDCHLSKGYSSHQTPFPSFPAWTGQSDV